MRRSVVVLALFLFAACADEAVSPGGGSSAPVTYRVISEKQNAAMCVRDPEFALAMTQEEWQQIWQRQTGCQPASSDAVPPLLATEVGVAAWWKVEGCLGHGIETTGVETNGAVVTVTALSSPPQGDFCATALGGLESFLALDRAAVAAANQIRFVLDGAEAGGVPVPS